MAKDNSTGKPIDFYDKGQAIFDRIPEEKVIIKSAPTTRIGTHDTTRSVGEVGY